MNYDDWNEQIPAYALGALDAQEAAALEHELAANPALRASLEAYRAIVGDLPIAVTPRLPPPRLKAAIMAEATTHRAAPAPLLARQPERQPWFWLPRFAFVAALGIMLLLAVGWATTATQLRQALETKQQIALQLEQASTAHQQTAAQLITAESALETVRIEQQALSERLAAVQRTAAQRSSDVQDLAQQLQSTQQALVFLSADTITSRSLRAVHNGTMAQGSMFMQPGQTNAVILVRGLPALDQTHSYQFWLADNQHQVNAGKLEVDANGSGRLIINVATSVDTFAQIMITVEQREPAPTPSDHVVLQGLL